MKCVWLYGSIIGLFIISVVGLYACKKSGTGESTGNGQEKPGQIPGMGSAPGAPQGSPFTLPAGITLKGEIVGNEDGQSGKDCVFDGQGMWVMVKMELQRDSTTRPGFPIEVVFPAGLVIVSAAEGFQHGLLVERVVVTIPPVPPGTGGTKCQVTLMTLCLNKDRTPSDRVAKYKFGPITNSPLIKDLIQRVSNKKINYAEYPPQSDEWSVIMEEIQDALWHITDGEGLTQRDIEHLKELPNR